MLASRYALTAKGGRIAGDNAHSTSNSESAMTDVPVYLVLPEAILGPGSEMFGWQFHPFGQGSEGSFQTPSLRAGIHGDDPNQGFLVFFGVPDLEVAIADVIRLGGAAEAPSDFITDRPRHVAQG